EATTVFADVLSLTIADPDHSEKEDRFVLLGMSAKGRMVVVVYTDRSENIRVISARLATRRETQVYEEG
ncbi:MAG TPA: BrnT family toxin, partial [Longimicrobiaceae bacterium]|nr:BrnT family toxin [Longimicrobiaceae bacterium]